MSLYASTLAYNISAGRGPSKWCSVLLVSSFTRYRPAASRAWAASCASCSLVQHGGCLQLDCAWVRWQEATNWTIASLLHAGLWYYIRLTVTQQMAVCCKISVTDEIGACRSRAQCNNRLCSGTLFGAHTCGFS